MNSYTSWPPVEYCSYRPSLSQRYRALPFHDRPQHSLNQPTTMPFVGSDAHQHRKRRWQDDEEDQVYGLYSPEHKTDRLYLNQHQERPRKILPLSKRARINEDELYLHDDHSPFSSLHRRRHSRDLPFGKPRSSEALLTPCHICHRKPTKKTHLDSFAECQGCGERTCYVCIRQCQGWNADEGSVLSEQEVLSRSFHMHDVDDDMSSREDHSAEEEDILQGKKTKGWVAGGHRSVVCSRCCVERGAEGDVVCLGCLSRVEGA